MRGLAIYGAGGMGRHVAYLARRHDFSEIVFVSDMGAEVGSIVNGLPVISFAELVSDAHREKPVSIAIADVSARRRLAEKCKTHRLVTTSLLSADAVVHQPSLIGEGAIVCGFTTIEDNARIGSHLHLHAYSYIAHDCVVGSFVTFAPRVSCNGRVVIEDDVYIGTGAIIKPGTRERPLRIGRGAYIGMGTLVTKDVPRNAVFVGNPGRCISKKASTAMRG
jgi:sugar O-acyltransferase (sialic acid O-acetyltransferase NeuD family)